MAEEATPALSCKLTIGFTLSDTSYIGLSIPGCGLMEAALERIDAGLLVLDEASNQPLVAVRDADPEVGTNFSSLDRLACNLKLGELKQVLAVNEDGVELGTRHKEGTVAVVKATQLENAIAADSLVDKLFE